MLLRFQFSNFRSFCTEQELSFIAGPFKDLPEVVLHSPGLPEGILPVAAIYGANASGKTNVIRALLYMASAVRSSHRDWKPDAPVPREPFALDEQSRRLPSRFAVDFVVNDIRHQYGFLIDSEAILEEWLFVYPKSKKQTWFHRKQGESIVFSSKMPGENRTIEGLTRKNSLFLSAAAQNNHDALLPIYRWFSGSLAFVVGERRPWQQNTADLCGSEDDRNTVAKLVSVADLGITDVHVEEKKIPEQLVKLFEAIKSIFELPAAAEGPGETQQQIQLLHRLGNQTVPFDIERESDGTIAYLSLLGPIVRALKTGGMLCVDELDASLHPLLAVQIMRLFNASSHNPKGAQLLFNTHDTNLLNSGVLRRDQIWFTEKKNDATTHLYPLSDFKPRRHENLENGYLQGRYGAIPFINPEAFLASLEIGNGKA